MMFETVHELVRLGGEEAVGEETGARNSILAQRAQSRRRNLTAESAPLSEAAIINQHKEHIRRSFGRLYDWYLVRLRVLVRLSDDTFEGRFRRRKHGAAGRRWRNRLCLNCIDRIKGDTYRVDYES